MVLKFLENPEVSKANSKDFLQTIFMAIRAIAVFWDQYACMILVQQSYFLLITLEKNFLSQNFEIK